VHRLSSVTPALRWVTTGLGLAAMLLGCASDGRVAIHAVGEDGRPFAGLEVTALPFDPDGLFDSLAAGAKTPRPSFTDLEAELRDYERPEEDALRRISVGWRATWDSVHTLADSLAGVRPSAPGYGAAYARLREQYRRLAQRAVERDRAFQEQIGDHRELATRAAAAADSLRAWEQAVLPAFAEAADTALARSGALIRSATTNQAGAIEIHLPAGAWWLIARQPDPENPFLERYWNIPLVVGMMGPLRVPLDDRNGVVRWRR